MVDQGIKSWLDSSQDHWLVCSQRLWYKWPKDPNYKEEECRGPAPADPGYSKERRLGEGQGITA